MFALIAVVLFAVALVLRLAHEAGDLVQTLVIGGLLALSCAHLGWLPEKWGNRP